MNKIHLVQSRFLQKSFFLSKTGLNIQFNLNGEIAVFNLKCRDVKERHFAENIKKWIQDAQIEFDITNHQIISLAIDSARNITKAVDDFIDEIEEQADDDLMNDNIQIFCEQTEITDDELDLIAQNDEDEDEDPQNYECNGEIGDVATVRVHCTAHKLQLAVNDFIWKNNSVKRTVVMSQRLAAKLRNSIVRPYITESGLNQAILDQKTRWSSTYAMLERLLELKMFCKQKENVFKGLAFSDTNWDNVTTLCEALKPLALLTTRLQAEQLDVSQFIYLWTHFAVFKLERLAESNNKAESLRKCVKVREQPIFENVVVVAATYLDKRFQQTLDTNAIERAKSFIMKVWRKKNIVAGEVETYQDDSSVQYQSQLMEGEDEEFAQFLGGIGETQSTVAQNTNQINDPSKIKAELKAFEELKPLRFPTNANIMEFWAKTNNLSTLAPIALDIISIPMTEVTVERMFSHLKFVLNEHRTNMSPKLLEDILFLRMNDKFKRD